MEAVAEIDARAGTQDAWAQLRALREVERLGLTRVVAADLAEGTHVVDIGHGRGGPHLRTLLRSEPLYWSAGYAGAAAAQVLAVEGEQVPDLLTLAEAAELIPSVWHKQGTPRASEMTADGVGYLIQGGELYALYALDGVQRGQYGTRRRRYVFALQVAWVAADRRAKALKLAGAKAGEVRAADATAETARVAWMQVRGLLPDVHRPATLRLDVTPAAAPVVVKGAQPGIRYQRALMIGDRRGWFEYLGPTRDGFEVVVDGRSLLLPGDGVLPFVLGAGDRQQPGLGRLVAYREGLG